MRVVCKDRKTVDLVDTLKRDKHLINLTTGVTPRNSVYSALDQYLSEWSRYLVSGSLSPKNK